LIDEDDIKFDDVDTITVVAVVAAVVLTRFGSVDTFVDIELFIKIHRYSIESDKQIMLKCNIKILFGEFN
jgi:hypothetical protein